MPFFSPEMPSETARAPALERLFEATKGCTENNFWEYDAEFNEFFRSGFLSDFLKGELARVAKEEDYSEIQSDDELELVRGNGFRISIGKLKAGRSPAASYSEIVCYASDFMCFNLGPSDLEVEMLRLPDEFNLEVFNRDARPVSISKRQQVIGESLRARAGVDILKFSPPVEDTFQLYAVALKPKVSLLWHFDATTLEARYCTAANLMASRVQTGIEILVRLNRKDAIPAIVAAAKSRDHFVRWTAISSVACMDEAEGVRLLQDALNDSHPDVRSAAKKALEILAQPG